MTNVSQRPFARERSPEHSGWYLGSSLVTFLATARDTNGHFGLIELQTRKGAEPPPHIHRNEDECFYILDGEIDIVIDGETHHGKPGSFIVIPRGHVHQPILRTEEATTLVLLVPGGGEGYFEEMSRPAEQLRIPPGPPDPADLERIASVATKYGGVFTDDPDARLTRPE